MSAKHVTIQEVAKQAGVSIQTVSRVLNDRPDVSAETRQRVQIIIDQMDYQPFSSARSLASQRTYTLGLVAADFSDFWFSQVVTGAEKEAQGLGYSFLLGSSACNLEDEPKFIRLITRHRVDGILFIRANCAEESELLNRLTGSGIPIVTTGNNLTESGLTMIDVDNIGGGRKATEYLLGLGHTRIAMLTGPSDWKAARDRTEGYLQALRGSGVPANPDLIKEGTWLHKSGYLGMKALLENKKLFTAVFAQNDFIAIGAISALHEAGVRVPEDISIIGYDDIPEAEFSNPPLTTIHQPLEEIGRATTRMLVQMIEDREATPTQFLFDTELVIRSSCTHSV